MLLQLNQLGKLILTVAYSFVMPLGKDSMSFIVMDRKVTSKMMDSLIGSPFENDEGKRVGKMVGWESKIRGHYYLFIEIDEAYKEILLKQLDKNIPFRAGNNLLDGGKIQLNGSNQPKKIN